MTAGPASRQEAGEPLEAAEVLGAVSTRFEVTVGSMALLLGELGPPATGAEAGVLIQLVLLLGLGV